jgi:hypothetical protein
MLRHAVPICLASLGLLVAACDDESSSPNTTPTAVGGSGGTGGTGTGGSGGSGGTGGTGVGGTGGTAGSGGAYVYAPADLHGRAFFGHYLDPYDLIGYGTSSLTTTTGTPVEPGDPAGDVLGVAKHDVVVITMEGGTTIRAYDAATLTELAGSPYTTGYGPTALAHDDATDRLYVYCIGTAGSPTESLLTVYDTSAVPWTELSGSPFDIDVPGVTIEVDPVTGTVFGLSLSSLWAVDLQAGAVVHRSGSPRTVDQTGSDLAIDPARRRLYVAERVFGGDQKLHAYDVDSFAPITGSPLTFAGTSLGDIVANPVTGDVFVVDYGAATLHAAAADPFALRNTCGTNGCALPPTETGLALDYELDRLFIAHVPDLNNPDSGNGFLSAWDVSDPASPAEVTVAGSRPALALYPNRASVQ